jgi:hypothetical protein
VHADSAAVDIARADRCFSIENMRSARPARVPCRARASASTCNT